MPCLVLPAVFACYKTDGNLKKLKKDNAYLHRLIDANIEGYRAIRNAGHKILPDADKEFEGAAYRKTYFCFFKLMCATALGKICASDHAMNAVDEMSALNQERNTRYGRRWRRRPGDTYDLTPAMCHLDYTMSEAGGVTNFVRQYTLASGGPYCDCGYKKKKINRRSARCLSSL